jgi:hypothetical protein
MAALLAGYLVDHSVGKRVVRTVDYWVVQWVEQLVVKKVEQTAALRAAPMVVKMAEQKDDCLVEKMADEMVGKKAG